MSLFCKKFTIFIPDMFLVPYIFELHPSEAGWPRA